jgi:hypothetical protein
MRGVRRAAIIAAVAAVSAACEALVGITDREVTAPGNEGGAEATTGDAPEGIPGETGSDATAVAEGGLEASGNPPDDQTSGGSDGSADGVAEGWAPVDANDGGPAVPDASDASDANVHLDAGGASDAADAAADGGRDPDVPCSMQGTFIFCEDFDTETTVGQDWTFFGAAGDGGTGQFDTNVYRSPPRSLQVASPPVSGAVSYVQVGKVVGPLATGVRLAFDVRPDFASYSTLPQIAVAQLILRQGTGGQVQLNYVFGAGGTAQLQAYVPADAGTTGYVNTTAPTLQTWQRVAIGVDSAGTVSLYLDGSLIGSTNIPSGPVNTVYLIAGAVYVNATGTEIPVFELDNIVLSAE